MTTNTIALLRQKITTKRAQRDVLDRDIKTLEAMLDMEIRDATRTSSLSYLSEGLAPTPVPQVESIALPDVPSAQEFIKPPNYGEWTISRRLTNALVEILLEERPMKRAEILKRLKERSDTHDLHDIDRLVSHFLGKDPRFISPYYGSWTLAMEPADNDKWHPDN